MKSSRSHKLRYYYSPELGVMMPVQESHNLKYWLIAAITMLAFGAFIFVSMAMAASKARNFSAHEAAVAAHKLHCCRSA